MNIHAFEARDSLFWAPLEKTLGKSPHEIEAMALDWLYEAIIRTIQRNTLLIVKPTETPLIVGILGEDLEYFLMHRAFWHSQHIQFTEKPETIEGLRKALRLITQLSDEEITSQGTYLLRIITAYARMGHMIIRRSGCSFIQMTDSRFPFSSMQQQIER